MSERSMAGLVCRALSELGLDPIRVENPARPGTPDVNYIEGWIELKELDRWPAEEKVVSVPHFRPEQRIWLDRRSKCGGVVHLLLKVEQDWVLLEGASAAKILGRVTRSELKRASTSTWRGSAKLQEELKRCLSRVRN